MGRKTKADPNGQRGNVRNTTAKLRKRLRRSQQRVLREFKAIPVTAVNAREKFYAYQYDVDFLWLTILDIMQGELGTMSQTMPHDWWYKSQIELPWRQGVLDEITDFNRIVKEPVTVQPILYSPQYLSGLRDAQSVNYGLIKTLGQDTAKSVFQVINDGMKGALTPTEIKQNIKDRFGVSESNAKRIARTEVNRAYTDARLNTVEQLEGLSGVGMGVVHKSALIPTTRRHHAARHNKVYTVQQQRKWWNTGANKINCYCSIRSIVFNEDGEIADPRQRKQFKDARNEQA
jgi:SPP1 gp7 family putative phage head morphogenesis protein